MKWLEYSFVEEPVRAKGGSHYLPMYACFEWSVPCRGWSQFGVWIENIQRGVKESWVE